MKQIWITRHGAPEVLVLREAPDPTPAAGEVRVRVKASGINFADLMARIGIYPDAPPPPMVVGYEVAGVIDAVGEGVDASRVGQRVLAAVRFGGYSDTVCAKNEFAIEMPAEMSFEDGAGLPVVYFTAHHMLMHLGNVKKGDTVLIHAAAGGVGLAALQICKHVGATTIGTASASKHEYLKAAGLDHAIDYHSQDFATEVKRITNGRGVEIALDAQGGDSLKKSFRVLAPTGRLFSFGAASLAPDGKRDLFSMAKGFFQMPLIDLFPLNLMNDNRGILGVNMGHLWNESQILLKQLDQLLALYREGAIKPVIDSTFSFEDSAKAHQRIHDRKNVGKVLLVP